MKHLKLISVFLFLFVIFILVAVGYDTKRNLNKLDQEIQLIDNELIKFETKYLEYHAALNLNDPEIKIAIVKYQNSSERELQQDAFDSITLKTLGQLASLDASNQAIRSIIDNLDGTLNRKQLLQPQKIELQKEREAWKNSFGAKLLSFF